MKPIVATLDRPTTALLTVIAVLLTVIAVELWGGHEPERACAQIPDTGKQRQELIDEARTTNRLLTDIRDHLRTKTIKVQVSTADDPKADRAPASRPPR